jgi:hypothetical protein
MTLTAEHGRIGLPHGIHKFEGRFVGADGRAVERGGAGRLDEAGSPGK